MAACCDRSAPASALLRRTSVEVFVTGGPQQARFVARNLECLQCHRELIPDFSSQSCTTPSMNKECTLCHTPHGSQVTVTVNTAGRRRGSSIGPTSSGYR